MQPLLATMTPVSEPEALATRWRALEGRCEPGFFLRWDWIGCWLAGLDTPPWLFAVKDASGQDIALGLFTHRTEWRRGVLRVRQLRLHDTGQRDADAITIEYNGLLCAPGMEDAAWGTMWRALREPGVPDWDEVVISGATRSIDRLLRGRGTTMTCLAETTSARVDLAALRADDVDDAAGYVARLGKSTRAQIRRSMKLYAERGPISVEPARDSRDAFGLFEELGLRHEAKWRALGRTSGFSNPAYLEFHRRLIETRFENGSLDLLKMSAGGEPFGWLYNFIADGSALFYLSGFVTEEDKRLKPGLVSHALAVERYLSMGLEIYDFMGGSDRYKSNLGEPGQDIVAYAVQRRRPVILLENTARALKARLADLRRPPKT